jgi:uncharacterized membrane protein
MKRRTFRIWTLGIAIALAVVVGWSITAANAYIPIAAVFIALGIKYLVRRSTRDVLHDERTLHINAKASALTVQILIPLAGLGAVVLIALRRYIATEMYIAGNVLAYFSCIFLITYQALYSYYSRKG